MKTKIYKKMSKSIVLTILIALCFTVTTFAIVFSMLSVEGNIFVTGEVDINLNDGRPLISSNDNLIFEPGMTEKRSFFIENNSSCDVYYRLYFDNLRGELADVLIVTICNGDQVLLEGTPRELSRENAEAVDDIIKRGGIRYLDIYFYLPEETTNISDTYFRFNFAVDATQVKNNPNKEFD